MCRERSVEKKLSSMKVRSNHECIERSSTSLVDQICSEEYPLTAPAAIFSQASTSRCMPKECVHSSKTADVISSSSKPTFSGFNWILDAFVSSDDIGNNVVTPQNSGHSLENGEAEVDLMSENFKTFDPAYAYAVDESEVMNKPLGDFSHHCTADVSMDLAIHGSDPFEDVNDNCLVLKDTQHSFDENNTRNMCLSATSSLSLQPSVDHELREFLSDWSNDFQVSKKRRINMS